MLTSLQSHRSYVMYCLKGSLSVALVLLAAALIVGCGGGGGNALGTGRIVYSSWQDGNDEICVIDLDAGGSPACLTDNAASDTEPAWSPDGTRIVFVSDRDGNREIYVMNADGSNQTRLTQTPLDDTTPAWSPDGGQISFYADQGNGTAMVTTINTDGSNMATGGEDWASSLAPDGRWYAQFNKCNGDDWEIVLIAPNDLMADCSAWTRLTNNTLDDTGPAWSPDGTRIVFVRQLASGDHELYIVIVDSGVEVRLTNHDGYDGEPDWGS